MAEQKYTAEYDPVDGEQHDWVVTNGDGFFVRTDEWNAAKIAQAMNVVAQLPKDATGKTVLPGSRVYWAFANGTVDDGFASDLTNVDYGSDFSRLYLDREDAEKAAKAMLVEKADAKAVSS